MPIQYPDLLPLWAFFILTVAFTLLCVEGGFRFGKHHKHDTTSASEASVGSTVGSTLSLLAFLLTFTFGIAAARFDNRRVLVLDEANSIGTTYLRADLLEQPFRNTVKTLLKDYVALRVQNTTKGEIPEPSQAEATLQDQLWAQAAIVGQNNPASQTCALFIESLNEMIDVQAKRAMARIYTRVPKSIWGALFLVAALSMTGVGYHAALIGKRNLTATLLLVFTFSTVMLLVADLDRPTQGSITANQQPMIDLQTKIDAAVK